MVVEIVFLWMQLAAPPASHTQAAASKPAPVMAWAGDRSQLWMRIEFGGVLKGSATDGPPAYREGCWTPRPNRAAELGAKLGLGAPFAAGSHLLVVFKARDVATATIQAPLACALGIEADLKLDADRPMPTDPRLPPEGPDYPSEEFMALPANTRLGSWDGVGVSDATLNPADEAAMAAQMNARLAGAIAEVLRNPEVAQMQKFQADINRRQAARGLPELPDPIGAMARSAIADPSGLRLSVRDVRFAAGAPAYEFVRADWYMPCPDRGCAGNFPDNRGTGASLEAWFTAPPNPRLLSLDTGPLLSKFRGWGVGVPGDRTTPVMAVPLADGRALLLTTKEMGEGQETVIYFVDPARGIAAMTRVYDICDCGD